MRGAMSAENQHNIHSALAARAKKLAGQQYELELITSTRSVDFSPCIVMRDAVEMKIVRTLASMTKQGDHVAWSIQVSNIAQVPNQSNLATVQTVGTKHTRDADLTRKFAKSQKLKT